MERYDYVYVLDGERRSTLYGEENQIRIRDWIHRTIRVNATTLGEPVIYPSSTLEIDEPVLYVGVLELEPFHHHVLRMHNQRASMFFNDISIRNTTNGESYILFIENAHYLQQRLTDARHEAIQNTIEREARHERNRSLMQRHEPQAARLEPQAARLEPLAARHEQQAARHEPRAARQTEEYQAEMIRQEQLQRQVQIRQQAQIQSEIARRAEIERIPSSYNCAQCSSELSSKDATIRRLTEELEALITKNQCGICMERESNTSFGPCGHLFCDVCIVNPSFNRCPKCRSSTKAIKPVYHSKYLKYKIKYHVLRDTLTTSREQK